MSEEAICREDHASLLKKRIVVENLLPIIFHRVKPVHFSDPPEQHQSFLPEHFAAVGQRDHLYKVLQKLELSNSMY